MMTIWSAYRDGFMPVFTFFKKSIAGPGDYFEDTTGASVTILGTNLKLVLKFYYVTISRI
jgi:hypothetical protein